MSSGVDVVTGSVGVVASAGAAVGVGLVDAVGVEVFLADLLGEISFLGVGFGDVLGEESRGVMLALSPT